jgi:hypothetical protein
MVAIGIGIGPAFVRGAAGGPEAVITALSPVAWYRFDDGAGTQLTDYSDNGYHGTFGATTSAPTWTDEGVSFDGGDHIELPARAAFQGADIVWMPNAEVTVATSGFCLLDHHGTSGFFGGAYSGAIANEVLGTQQLTGAGYASNSRRYWQEAGGTISSAWHLLQSDWLGESPFYSLVLDGTNKANQTFSTPEEWRASAGGRIGKALAGTLGFTGSIGTIVLYPTGRTTQQQVDCRTGLTTMLSDRGITLT